ncbi:MAG: S1 RNA-binding domain-containing protein, partial [Microgenomates group bacterium]
VLTDIMGIEDFGGDMDFKVTGSKDGVTAMQLDVKNNGLTDKMIEEILEKALTARLFILDKMNAVIDKPRGELSEFAPKVKVFTPPQEKIGEIIGPGGKNIRNLIAKFGVDINVDNAGVVSVSGVDKTKVDDATAYIENMVRDIQEGEQFEGEVKRMLPFGAFVEMLPGKEGMVHVSKMGKGFVKDPSEVLNIGDMVKVRVYQIDQQGRVNLELVSGGTGTGTSTMDSSEGGQGGGRPPRRFDRGGSRGGSRGGYGGGSSSRGGSSHHSRPAERPQENADPNFAPARKPRIEIE